MTSGTVALVIITVFVTILVNGESRRLLVDELLSVGLLRSPSRKYSSILVNGK